MTFSFCNVESPVGTLTLVAEGALLREIRFPSAPRLEPGPGWREGGTTLLRAARQLEQYFAGERREFELELGPQGTPFQERVWRELARIPYGRTTSYGALARRVGNPNASRAVGAANGRNPLPIVIPCHRVVGADGRLTGFGGGIETKRFLLEHEAELLVR